MNTLYTVDLARYEKNAVFTADEAHHLQSEHADRLDSELATAHVKKVFKVRAKKVDDEDIVQAFLAEIMYLGNSLCRRIMHYDTKNSMNIEANLDLSESYSCGIRLEVAAHRFCAVPSTKYKACRDKRPDNVRSHAQI